MEAEKSHYEDWYPTLGKVQAYLVEQIRRYSEKAKEETGHAAYEHLIYRVKEPSSMNEKCTRKGYEVSAYTALRRLYDAIGLRVVCRFISDIYWNIEMIRKLPGCRVVREKDYIRNVKPNGYRSYHMILRVRDIYVEVQLRTISMDTWAALEHQLRYKKVHCSEDSLIFSELKRCADELASTDISMQTIRDMIRKEGVFREGEQP